MLDVVAENKVTYIRSIMAILFTFDELVSGVIPPIGKSGRIALDEKRVKILKGNEFF